MCLGNNPFSRDKRIQQSFVFYSRIKANVNVCVVLHACKMVQIQEVKVLQKCK